MMLLRHLTAFFLSLRTTLWLLGFLLVLLLAGAVIMPGEEAFQGLHAMPLYQWLRSQPLQITWWLWGLILLLIVLAVNTLFCSIESIVKKRKVTQWLLLIAPQIIHAGFLLVLIAHLVSAFGTVQKMAAVREGTRLELDGQALAVRVADISVSVDYYGYVKDWDVMIEYESGGSVVGKDSIRPNQPALHRGYNINIKDIRTIPMEMALLQINREPGALWALAGGLLFMTGVVSLIALKIRMER